MTDLIDDGTGPALVFLHGAGVDNLLWEPQRAAFRQAYRLIIPNLPGHGGVPPARSVEDMADRVQAQLQALDVQRYALVGLSLGGMVALEMAARWPEQVTHLALIESVPAVAHTRLMRNVLGLCLQPLRLIPPRLLVKLPARSLGAQTRDAGIYVKTAMARLSAARTHALLQLAVAYDGRPHLPRLRMPCSVMVGAENRQTHTRAQAMAKAIPTCRYQIIEGAGHIANRDAPEAVNAALATLLAT